MSESPRSIPGYETSREFEAAYKLFVGAESMMTVYIILYQQFGEERDIIPYYKRALEQFYTFKNRTGSQEQLHGFLMESTERSQAYMPKEETMEMPARFEKLYESGVLSDQEWKELRTLYYGLDSEN